MKLRIAGALVTTVLFACGGKVVGDDQDGGPVIPVEETGTPEFTHCDDKLSGAWAVGCDGSGVSHGQLCTTPAGTETCLAASNGCEGPAPEDVLLACDPGFFSTPGAKLGVDIDSNGCVTSVEYSVVDVSVVQCALDRLSKLRFPCNGSTTITTPCKFH